MILFIKLASLFVIAICTGLSIYLAGKKKGFEDGFKKGQKRPGNQHFDDVLRPLLLGWRELEPSFEGTVEMGVDRYGQFYFVQQGQGGGTCGILCGLTGKHCDKECFKKHALYFNPDGEPLFFCRYYYTIFKGKKYSEYQDDPEIKKLAQQLIAGNATQKVKFNKGDNVYFVDIDFWQIESATVYNRTTINDKTRYYIKRENDTCYICVKEGYLCSSKKEAVEMIIQFLKDRLKCNYARNDDYIQKKLDYFQSANFQMRFMGEVIE